MPLKTFQQCLSEAAAEMGLDPALVVKAFTRAKQIEAKNQTDVVKEGLQATGQVAKGLAAGVRGALHGAVEGAKKANKK